MKFSDRFLLSTYQDKPSTLEEIRASWGMHETEFVSQIENWFGNFDANDKSLALKVLKNINYYSSIRFTEKAQQHFNPIERFLNETGKYKSDLLIILPENEADSAHRHAYEITKAWGLGEQIVLPVQLKGRLNSSSVLVTFNDTHGSGKQFFNDIWTILSEQELSVDENMFFVVSITIAEKALRYFEFEFKDKKVRVIPSEHDRSSNEIFTLKEYLRLEELGHRVYPPHPMGYGDAGLLTAYYFQCPNNSLPIIWANGQNNKVNGVAYSWTPLFPYIPKPARPGVRAVKEEPISLPETPWPLSDDEKQMVERTIRKWKCNPKFWHDQLLTTIDWFKNFETKDKDLALKIFYNTEYLSIVRVREMITELKKKLMDDVLGFGRDRSDILLVLSGYEKASVYHYVYDFLRIWNLKVNQVITLEELKAHHAVGKCLVYFYHTRAGSGAHFIDEVWNFVKDLPVNTHYIISYALNRTACKTIENLPSSRRKKIFAIYDEQSSIGKLFTPDEVSRLRELISVHRLQQTTELEDSFLLAYYFICPDITCTLLREKGTTWAPLFLKKKTNSG